VYQNPSHLYNCTTKKCLYFNRFTLTPRQLCTRVANLPLCCIIFIWFRDDCSIRTESCRNNQCDIV